MKLHSAKMSKPEKLLLYSLWVVVALFALTVTSTHYCEISNPETHTKYDLRKLIPSDEDIHLKFTNSNSRIGYLTPLRFLLKTIRMRLCSPLKCNNQDGYALCIHYSNNKEEAIGKFPPQVSYENGHTLFKFEGGICPGSTRYNLTISMMCDYQAGNNSYPILVSFDSDSCNIHIKWPTSVICPTRKYVDCTAAHNNDHYDLSPLISYAQNYEFHTEHASRKMLLNVCHSVIHKPGINCSSEAGICMCDEIRRKCLNLGEVQRPPFFAKGYVQLEYRDGDLCDIESSISPTLLRYKTTIIFVCSLADEKAFPQYEKKIDECHYKITWHTPAACGTRYLLNNNFHIPNICSVVNPITKSIYSLEPLTSNDYEVEGELHGYKIRICKPLSYINGGCGEGTGMCNMMSDIAKGKANTKLIWTSDGPYLKYLSSDRCDNNTYDTTIIQFMCSPNKLDSRPVVMKDDSCYRVIHWETDLVCEKQIQCITDGNDPIDLTPLMQFAKNYILKDARTNVEYHINICRPLVATPNLSCGHDSAACLVEKDLDSQHQHEVSLGYLENIPKLNEDLQVVLCYVGGGRCIENDHKRLSTNITFICSGNEQVSPVYKNYVDCTYLFEWNTKLACGTMIETWLPPCFLENKDFGYVYDLSALYKEQQVHYVESILNTVYTVNICNREKYCNGSAICREYINYGSLHGIFFNYKRKSIRLEYSTTEKKCRGDSYTAQVIFRCNEFIDIGKPEIEMESECRMEFVWETELVCTLGLDFYHVTINDKQPTQVPMEKSFSNHDIKWILLCIVLILLLVAMIIIIRYWRRRAFSCNCLYDFFQACISYLHRRYENSAIFHVTRLNEETPSIASESVIYENDDHNNDDDNN